MKTPSRMLAITALTLAAAPQLFAQGSLTPSAAPAPTMKTLDEIEPRTIISSLPYTISASGSYYLGTNVAISTADAGITISASNVTIDLNGHTLTGAAGSLSGIAVSGTPSVIHIKNGIISSWEAGGIDFTGATRCIIEDLTVDSCTGVGVILGANSTLRNCQISGNSGDGVETTGIGCHIHDNGISDNSRGIDLTSGQATVENNRCFSNGNRGIYINSDENVVINNETTDNSIGFEVAGSNNRIANNYTYSNGNNAESNQVLTAAQTNNNQYDLLISDIPELLDRSCNARLTGDVVNTIASDDGIVIDADNVTLDLGGFTVYGSGNAGGAEGTTVPSGSTLAEYVGVGVSSDDGIFISGSQENITIRNGSVAAWGGDGINALNADFSTFENLQVSYNDGDGLVTDFNCVITKCVARANGLDGLEGDDGTVITDCSAGQNEDNGIQVSEGCVVTNCASYYNETDGFDIGAGGLIEGCASSDNLIYGFDMALGSVCRNSNAYDNGSSESDGESPASPVSTTAGFDMASSCILDSCHSALNQGHGVRTYANSRITNSKFHENDFDGIRISSTDCLVEGNSTSDNDVHGIQVNSSGCLIISNRSAGDLYNYDIVTTSTFGPIIDVTGAGDTSSVSGADHPYANFSY